MPIDFREVWLPQILRYADLVIDGEALARAWIDGDRSEHSVTDWDELFEQVFDDLDSERLVQEMPADIRADRPFAGALAGFVAALLDLDRRIGASPELRDAAALLASPDWAGLEAAARTLRSSAASRSGRSR